MSVEIFLVVFNAGLDVVGQRLEQLIDSLEGHLVSLVVREAEDLRRLSFHVLDELLQRAAEAVEDLIAVPLYSSGYREAWWIGT